jgi:DNA topoisomerase-1
MSERWILRRGTKRSGFRYEASDGSAVRDRATLARIAALVIPPAWTDVHIAPSARAAVQAWGYDARGRKQYRYHDRARQRGELRKYYRVRQLGRDLPEIRRLLAGALRGRALTRDRVAAGVVQLIAQGFFRPGSERYTRENHTFGLTTMRKRHVSLEDGCAVFDYVGKGRIRQHQVIPDPRLVAFVRQLLRTPGARLFRFQDAEAGEWCDLGAREVNEYLQQLVDFPYKAKDFRTWGGTLRLATILADIGPAASEGEARKNVTTAVRLVAAELGNTPMICRKSYVHPVVIERYLEDGETIADHRSHAAARSGAHAGARGGHTPEEAALVAFLDEHFPERRRRPRAESAAEDDAPRARGRRRARPVPSQRAAA